MHCFKTWKMLFFNIKLKNTNANKLYLNNPLWAYECSIFVAAVFNGLCQFKTKTNEKFENSFGLF